jgi:hypothetical protein
MSLSDAAITMAFNSARAMTGLAVVIVLPKSAGSIPCTAIPLDVIDDAEETREVYQTRARRDFGFYLPDLVLNGTPYFPTRGWWVQLTEAGQALSYEVLPPKGSDDVHERMDHAGLWLRVHTREINP